MPNVGPILGTLLVIFAIIILALIVIFIIRGIIKAVWKVAEPNEALIVSGTKKKPVAVIDPEAESSVEEIHFKVVTGRGTVVIPVLQTARSLKLNLNQTDLTVECVTKQGIEVHLKGSVIFKIGDSVVQITNAARRFLDQQEQMVDQVKSIFSGHLREIVGSMSIEDLIRERQKVRSEVRDASGTEMEKLGLIIDSLQINEITEPGTQAYIKKIAAPAEAAIESAARIAKATSNREAAQAEAEAEVLTAKATKEASTQVAAYQAEIAKANAESAQAGPLAEATARQAVVQRETEIATLEAAREAERLEATVRKPADASAYAVSKQAEGVRDAAIRAAEGEARKQVLDAQAQAEAAKQRAEAIQATADAQAHATKAAGQASADAIRAKGEAEGAAIQARADALATNQDAVISQQVAENLPAIVAELAKPWANVDQVSVVNGAEGFNSMITSGLAQLGVILPQIRTALGNKEERVEQPEKVLIP